MFFKLSITLQITKWGVKVPQMGSDVIYSGSQYHV